MEERKFINLKKEEFGIKTYIKRDLGKGKISKLDIEYTPVGEKIIISTSKPGLVIGRRGEKIQELTTVLKKRFKLENPHIEIKEIENPLFDAQIVADEIAMALERMGNLKFKVIAYRKLQEIMNAGALGCELRLSGKLPSERSRPWRFAEGYLKKAGESSKEIDRAQATALTRTGIIGIKVAIMAPDARMYDKIEIDEKIKKQINNNEEYMIEEQKIEKPKKLKKKKPIKKKKEVEKEDKKEPKKKINKKIEKIEKEIAKDITKTEDKVEEKKITQKQADKEIKEEVKKDIKEMN
jgi:small subunit ribosomal protein S3